MSSSRCELILRALLTSLNGLATVTPRIYRSRQEAFGRAAAPALVVEPVSNEPQPNRAGVTTMPHHLEVRLLLLIDDPIPDQAADPILVDIHNRFMADVTLGGLASNIEPGTTTWGMEPDGVAVVETHYVVKYRTLIKDLTRAV
jgi:hypothetical protein